MSKAFWTALHNTLRGTIEKSMFKSRFSTSSPDISSTYQQSIKAVQLTVLLILGSTKQ